MTSQVGTPNSRLVFWSVLALFPVIFLIDAVAPLGIAISSAYVPLVCLGLWLRVPRSVFHLAACATVLSLVGAACRPHHGVPVPAIFVNRFISVGTVWWVATGVFRYRLAADALERTAVETLRTAVETGEALLASVVASSDDAILSKTLDGTIRSWNRGATEIFGYTAEEAIGRQVAMLIPEELLDQEVFILDQVAQGRAVEHLETVRVSKSGRRIEVSITVLPVKDASGKIIGASKNVREIGTRKATEAMLAAVVDNATDGLISIDEHGRVESFNRSCEKMFGYSATEVLGENIRMLMPEPYLSEHDGYLARYSQTGETHIIGTPGREVAALRKDGSVFPMDLSVSAFQLFGARHFSGILRDITEKKRIETEAASYTKALIRSNQALDDFAYAASHDLKAPLRVIDNASKWLEEDLAEHLTGEMRENMQMLRGRVKRMDKLLNDLLAYSRIGRKSDAAYAEMVCGRELIADVVAMVAPLDTFRISVSPTFADIQVCRMPLQQILMNLINNAIKHHDRNFGEIEVSVEPGDPMHTFAVKDDGPGIDPRFHARIFDMFQTLKPRDQVEGSGMGLAMVRKHVEIMGGAVAVDSAVGRGSIFRFTWPARQPAIGTNPGGPS